MSQFARPANDISLGGWSGPAWSKINEVVPDDDASYTEKTGSGTLEVGLSGVADPKIRTEHIIKFSVKQQSGAKGPEDLLCELYDGSTKITEISSGKLVRGAYITVEHAIPEAEANLIADYNLILKFTPTQGDTEVMRLTWAEVKLPDVAGEEHSGSGSISGNGSLAGTTEKGGRGSALKSAAGTLLAIGLAGMLAVASIAGGGSQVAVGKKSTFISAAISGGGSLIVDGQAVQEEEYSGIATVSGNGILAGVGMKQAYGDLDINGEGFIVAIGPIVGGPPGVALTGFQISREERGRLLLISNPDDIVFIGKKKPALISKE